MTSDFTRSTDQHSNENSEVVTSEEFDGWIRRIAEAENVSEAAVRRQLISVFWSFEELSGILDESPFDQQELSNFMEGSGSDQTGLDSVPDSANEPESGPLDRSGPPDTAPEPERIQPSWETLLDIIEALDDFGEADTDPSDTADGLPSDMDRRVGQLQSDLEELAKDLEAVDQRTKTRVQEIADRVAAIEESVDGSIKPAHLKALCSAFDERISRIDSSIETVESTVAGEVDRLEDRLSKHVATFEEVNRHLGAHADRLTKHDDRISSQGEGLHAAREQLATHEARFDEVASAIDRHRDAFEAVRETLSEHESELQSAETVLRHLFDELDRVDNRIDGLTDSVEGLEPLISAHRERRHLEDIKQEAARIDRWLASCEACGERIQIGRLARPQCPHCEVPIRDVEVDSGWFRSKTLLTTDEQVGEFGLAWKSPRPDAQDDGTSAESAVSGEFRFRSDT